MSANSLSVPFPIFNDIDGDPLDAGYIYIGTANLDPETNPISVYFDADLTIPAAQPIRTLNGFPSNSGSPARLYVNADDYSMTVKNKNGSLIYTALNSTERNPALNISADDGASGSLWTTVQGFINYLLSSAGSSVIGFIQSGVGAIQRTIQAKLREQVSVLDFGAVGDGATDDTSAIQAALDSGASKIYLLGGTAGFVVDSDLSIPVGAALIGDYEFIDPRNGASFNDANYPSRLILNSTASITLDESASVKGVPIVRKGSVFPANAAEVANFAGTAIKFKGLTTGHYVGHCAIIGFNTAILDDAANNTEQWRCEYLNIDCINGVLGEQNFDIVYVENVHCWPTASVGVLPSPADADLQRSGVAFQFKNGGDWNKWTNCFAFGYARGYVIDACNSVTALGCGADYTVTQTVNPIGYEVKNAASEPRFIACQAAGQNIGFYLNSTSNEGPAQFVGCNTWECDAHHVLIDDGKSLFIGGSMRAGSGSGISPNTADICTIIGVHFNNVGGNAINSTSASNVVRHRDCVFDGVTGVNVGNPYKPTVASADPLVLNGIDVVLEVTGTTSFGTLNNAADYAGKVVSLKFTGGLTVFDGASLKLAGDFVTTADDVLTLISDGTAWYEVSRSVN